MTASDISTIRADVARLRLLGHERVIGMSDDDLAAAYNGTGPAFLLDEIRRRLDNVTRPFQPAIMVHDVDYSHSTGRRKAFLAANRHLFWNCLTCATDAHPWHSWRRYALVIEAFVLYRACTRFGWIAWLLAYNQKQERELTMNKTMMFAAMIGCAIALTGCVSEELTWGGQKAVRQPDGTVLVDQTTGKPYYEKDQNHLERFSHLTDVELKELHVKADAESYEAHLGQIGSFCGSNTVSVINASVGGATKLVAEAGALYAKIAGGASADVISSLVGKAVALFKSQGGNVDTAAASLDGNRLKITDGKTCVTCDVNGNCTTGACSE